MTVTKTIVSRNESWDAVGTSSKYFTFWKETTERIEARGQFLAGFPQPMHLVQESYIQLAITAGEQTGVDALKAGFKGDDDVEEFRTAEDRHNPIGRLYAPDIREDFSM
ncbi:hypothetical protein EVAR_4245_1 [Eumeta japonica]|uniref:Uncharacterized protein n=1 Tax=Eumeta variegata TaxID=151549 RepID=A0A4C1TIS9_EUMVA|nr:hypothetical protein EVAR_4245_1 [Eumeta japonica]